MGTPHKHAALIKAWADGAVIQWRFSDRDTWADCGFHAPKWDDTRQYRIKPEPVKVTAYKRYLYKCGDNVLRVCIVNNDETYDPKRDFRFIKWLDNEWVELTHEESGTTS